MNTVKAAYQALMNQRLPDEIARGRGKKLVDVRKVYYGGEQKPIGFYAKLAKSV
jgi:small subunit ribosomal protein S5